MKPTLPHTRWISVARCLPVLLSCAQLVPAADYQQPALTSVDRPWLGPEVWANPVPDWRLEGGRWVCTHPGGNRNVVLLTHELTAANKPFRMQVTLDQLSETVAPRGGWAGFQLGLQGRFNDYRDSAVFGRGFAAGVCFGGRLFIGGVDQASPRLEPPFRKVTLDLVGSPAKAGFELVLRALDPAGRELARVTRNGVDPSWLTGLVALTVSTAVLGDTDLGARRPEFKAVTVMGTQRGGQARVAFSGWRVEGPKVKACPERAFGPILWCQHSLQNDGTLKLLAQFPPLGGTSAAAALKLNGRIVAREAIEPVSGTALFTVRGFNINTAHRYEVILDDPGVPEKGTFSGQIRAIPQGRVLTMAAFSCNDGTGFPHQDLVRNVRDQKPDFLAFLGDQIYEGVGGYGVLFQAGERSILDYLRKYYLHGWVWRDLLRDLPSATIPDDHDVFHGNLWGNGGKAADVSLGGAAAVQDSGGYKMPAEFVNAVHRTQTGNLPDPVDPTPADRGISVYFTRWLYGPLDLAIVADRQWKSAPKPLLPQADIVNGFARNQAWNPRTESAHPDAQLLGARQETFLKQWAGQRTVASPFRVVLSQTPWNCLGTLPEGQHRSDSAVPGLPILAPGQYPSNDVCTIDLDANGWPKAKRDLALTWLKRGGAMLHIAGDQHLGSTGRYGIHDWNDGPYWIATPAIANLWPRRWFPSQPGGNAKPGDPRYTGEFEDQFGNKVTVLAVANPVRTDRDLPIQIGDRAPGYTIVRFDPRRQQITLENWAYWASPRRPAPDNLPFPGWPVSMPAQGNRTR